MFVSLKINGELRGCIGTIAPVTDTIAEEIIRNSLSAAINDPRFSPLTQEELKEVDISVDLLHEPEKTIFEELNPKEYGVIVSFGAKRGLLLPNLEGIDTSEQQVAIAMEKGKEAMFYEEKDGLINCYLCPHRCKKISEGHKGVCGVREVKKDEEGAIKLYSINYGEITSLSMDPIEKKPLYEFYPGTMILSIGSFGCNFKCSFCQNYSISQYRAESKYIPPEEMAEISMEIENNIGLAFTYNEPSIWYEYVYDVARKIKERNKEHKVVLVTNGYICNEPLKKLLPYVDALNIDLKGGKEYYKKLCFGELEAVKETIKIAYEMGKHIEVTTLLIPCENTDDETLMEIATFLSSLNKDIPLHLSRYFPRYKMNLQPTPIDEIKKSYHILKKYLNHIYLGNLTAEEIEYCINGE